MKTIKKLKLTRLSLDELEKREMNSLIGGGPGDSSCKCKCSSSNSMNSTLSANAIFGYQYSYGGNYYGMASCACDNEAPVANVRSTV